MERVEVSGYSGAGGAIGIRGLGSPAGLVANCHLRDNSSAGVVLANADGVVLYGVLAHDNSGTGIQLQEDTDVSYVVNATCAGNGGYGYRAVDWCDGNRILNSVFSGNGKGVTNDTSGKLVVLLKCNIDDVLSTGFSTNGYGSVAPLTGTCELGPANLDERFRPTEASPAIDSGRTVNMGDYRFVDIQNDGNYDEGYDIVVFGKPPADPDGDDRVYLKGVLGEHRVRRGEIDMGAIETQPPAGTIVIMK